MQVWCGLKFIQVIGPSLRKGMQNYNYSIRYESEYLFRAALRALEEVHASKGS
jgi:hypothetical protein